MIHFRKQLPVLAVLVLCYLSGHETGAQGFYETASRQSSQGIFGSAKAIGMAGCMMGTGADPAAMAVNPAAPGLARKSSVQFSLMPYLHTARSTFRDSEVNSEKAGMPFGSIGLSLVNKDENKSGFRGGVFSMSYNRTQQSSRRVSWEGTSTFYQKGKVTQNSLIDFWLNNLNQPGYRPDDIILDEQPVFADNFKNDVVMAYDAYLLDADGNTFVSIFPNSDLDKSGSFSQNMTSGNWNAGYSADFNDKFFLGFSAVYHTSSNDAEVKYSEKIRNVYVSVEEPLIPIEVYNSFQKFRGIEFTVQKNSEQQVRGVSGNFGLLYKASDAFRLSFSYQLPSILWITEKYTPKIIYNFNGVRETIGGELYFPQSSGEVVWFENEFRYKLRTPARMRTGITWIAGKSGMLEGSMEVTNQGNARLYDGDNYNFTKDNPLVSQNFGWQVNLRAGGELRLGEYRMRGGIAYLPTALKSEAPLYLNIPGNQLSLTCGFGGRFDLWYWDIALHNAYFQVKNNYLSGYDQDVSTRMNLLQLHFGLGLYL